MRQYVITPAAGKRLIAKATAAHPAVRTALKCGTVVIVAGTTNGYVAEEVLKTLGQSADFSRKQFFRGITLPTSRPTTGTGRLPDDLDQLAAMLNAPGGHGPRLWPVPGETLTELDAISSLTGASASLVAGGGVCGAEGSVWLAVAGSDEQETMAQKILEEVSAEPLFLL